MKAKPKKLSIKYFKGLDALLPWYKANQRKLPWRRARPRPYEIWIAEVMSQQSTMPTVVEYWKRWMKVFPSLEGLAKAKELQVLKAWEGLGYYSRARNILKASKELVKFRELHKRWPVSHREWETFPGVGPYTARAISSTAFSESKIPVDGNVYRVMSRYLGILNPLNDNEDRRIIEEFLEEFESNLEDNAEDWAQSFMELGATLCRPRGAALCEACPLEKNCYAREMGNVLDYPLPKRRRETLEVECYAIAYNNSQGAFLLRQIPEGRRLAGQWELPFLDIEEGAPSMLSELSSRFEVLAEAHHNITHHRYKAYLLRAGLWKGPLPESHKFLNLNNLESFPGLVSTLSRKLLLKLEKASN